MKALKCVNVGEYWPTQSSRQEKIRLLLPVHDRPDGR